MIAIAGAFLSAVVVWALEARYFGNYLQLEQVLLSMGKCILLLTVIVGIISYRWWWQDVAESWQRGQRLMGILLVCLLIVPPTLSWTNRQLGQPSSATVVELVQEQARYTSRYGSGATKRQAPNQYHLSFYWNNRLYRISYKEGPRFAMFEEGDPIELPIAQGYWGYHWINFNAS